MKKSIIKISLGIIAASALSAASGCNSNDNNNNNNQGGTASPSLYDKYGGAPTIQKVVADAATALVADCVENPFFTNTINFDNIDVDGAGHGANGHDTADRLESCLVAQFTAAFGGPSTYVGTSATSAPSLTVPGLVYDCEDMTTAHAGLGIPTGVFDQFISDVGAVLLKDGVSQADINTVAAALMGFQTNIVAPTAQQINYNYVPGDPANQPTLACSIAAPSPSPSPSASPSPSPSATVSPTPSPSPSSSP